MSEKIHPNAAKMVKQEGGYECPLCHLTTAVSDSRSVQGFIRRRRVCRCGHRFTTFETEIDSRKDFLPALENLMERGREVSAAVTRLMLEAQELHRTVAFMKEADARRYGNAAALIPTQTPQE